MTIVLRFNNVCLRMQLVFTARRNNASAVLGIEIQLFSVLCLSVCVSDSRVLCGKTKEPIADILIPHARKITLVL